MSQQQSNVSLDEDTIDDLLYSARVGDKDALEADLTILASQNDTTPSYLLSSAIDETTGNSVVHYACANGHQGGIFKLVLKNVSLLNHLCRSDIIHPHHDDHISTRYYNKSTSVPAKCIRQYASTLRSDERPLADRQEHPRHIKIEHE